MFRIPIIVTVLLLVVSYIFGGWGALLIVIILGVLEVSFSFDNAVVNAKILQRMNDRWRRLFLTVGVLIAVFGMRLIFPLIIVALAAHMNPVAALQLAVQKPDVYAGYLMTAHPAIASFGGIFLIMLFLDWLFEEREVRWLRPIENTLFRLGRIENMSTIIAATLLVVVSVLLGHTSMVLLSGVLGLVTYLLVSSIDTLFDEGNVTKMAKAGLATFLYLEVLDASFSFDGVVGAFAITSNIFLIALGLGIGAMYVRSLTVMLVHRGTLQQYVHLEHGAHWAIGLLAILLLLTIKYDISGFVTGLLGVSFIGASIYTSKRYEHRIITH